MALARAHTDADIESCPSICHKNFETLHRLRASCTGNLEKAHIFLVIFPGSFLRTSRSFYTSPPSLVKGRSKELSIIENGQTSSLAHFSFFFSSLRALKTKLTICIRSLEPLHWFNVFLCLTTRRKSSLTGLQMAAFDQSIISIRDSLIIVLWLLPQHRQLLNHPREWTTITEQ